MRMRFWRTLTRRLFDPVMGGLLSACAMKPRKTLPTLISSIALFFAATTAKAEAVFQFGFFAPELQLVDASEDVKGLRINFVYGENVDVSGVDLGIVNSTTGNFFGFGWAPGANLVKGTAEGVQWAWLYSHTAGEFTGWQSGLISRVGGAGSVGFQSGLINLAEADFKGLQLGFFNKSAHARGVQFGFVNWADRLDGLQIGLVNYAENSDVYKVLPFVNWQF